MLETWRESISQVPIVLKWSFDFTWMNFHLHWTINKLGIIMIRNRNSPLYQKDLKFIGTVSRSCCSIKNLCFCFVFFLSSKLSVIEALLPSFLWQQQFCVWCPDTAKTHRRRKTISSSMIILNNGIYFLHKSPWRHFFTSYWCELNQMTMERRNELLLFTFRQI